MEYKYNSGYKVKINKSLSNKNELTPQMLSVRL